MFLLTYMSILIYPNKLKSITLMFKSCLAFQAQPYQSSQRAWLKFLTALWGTQHLFNRPALSWTAGWNPRTGWLIWIVQCLVYQHGILPRNLWPLLICAAPICTVETLERKVSNHLRKKIVLLKDLSSIVVYRHNNRQQPPFKLLEKECKATRPKKWCSNGTQVISPGCVTWRRVYDVETPKIQAQWFQEHH